MLNRIRNALSALVPSQRRSFDGAGGGSRWQNARHIDNVNSAILAAAPTVARRASYYARNNPWIVRGIEGLVANAVGTGIKPRSKHPNPKVRDALHRLWADWCEETGHYAQQGLALRTMLEAGEVFGRLRIDEANSVVPLAVDLIDREQVPKDRFSDTGARIRAGIEFDPDGRRVAYHVLPQRPGDPFTALTGDGLNAVRIPAEDAIHLFEDVTPGQLRGMSRLAPVLLRLHELDQFEDAALVKARVSALFAGFIVDPSGSPTVPGALDPVSMEPGALVPLPPGADVRFSDPKTDVAYDPFVRAHLRAIAAGLGVTYEMLTGDLSGVNYSSIRAGLVEFRRSLEALQHNVIIPRFCRPIWRRFVTTAFLSGALDGFGADLPELLSVEWLPPRFDWVDPGKDIAAEVEAIRAGLKSRAMSVAERGYDVEEIDAAIAADRAREIRLGLSFDAPAPAPANNNPAPGDA